MKAIAKHLPVEGEIKVGDYYDQYGIISKVISKEQAEYQTKQGFKRIKLFAVTQDIKIGDEIISKSSKYKGIYKGFDGIKNITIECEGKEIIFTDTIYKVLGEISPEATWAKDGDEIEIRTYTICTNCNLEKGITDNCLGIYPTCEYLKIAEIKCPTCKTFH